MKTVCQTDADGLFVGLETADLDMYDKDGGYLLPAGCVDAMPPETKEGQAARWNGTGWDYIPDHRGQTAYLTDTGAAVTVGKAGELDTGLTLIPPPCPWHTWDGKQWTLTAAAKAGMLKRAKAAKQAEINRLAAEFVNQASGMDAVPDFETATWQQQGAEAKAWAENHDAETPMLAQIAAARGIPLDKLRAAALKKTQAYTALSAHIAGMRQHYTDLLHRAKDVDAVQAVVPVYAMPKDKETV